MPIKILCWVSGVTRPRAANLMVYITGAHSSGEILCQGASLLLSCLAAVAGRNSSLSETPILVRRTSYFLRWMKCYWCCPSLCVAEKYSKITPSYWAPTTPHPIQFSGKRFWKGGEESSYISSLLFLVRKVGKKRRRNGAPRAGLACGASAR